MASLTALRGAVLLLFPLLGAIEAVITPLGTQPSEVLAQVGRCELQEDEGGTHGAAEPGCSKNKYFPISTCASAPRVRLVGDGCNLLDLTDPQIYAIERSIVFWGDSLTVQMYDALICLLQQAWDDAPEVKRTRTDRRRLLDAKTLRPSHHPRGYGRSIRLRITRNRKVPSCKAEPQDECHRFGRLRVCYQRLIDHHEDMGADRTGCLGRHTVGTDSLHIFNFGLWYPSTRPPVKGKPPPTYQQALKIFRRFIAASLASLPPGPPPRLLWRETTPQFFDTPGGNYDRASYSRAALSQCKSTVDRGEMMAHEWRNSVASAALMGVPGMEVFHVWELLQPWGPRLTVRTPLASERGKSADCTHWCSGPLKAIGHLLISDAFNRYWRNHTIHAFPENYL